MQKTWVLSYPLSARQRLRLGGCPGWSESSLGAQSFCWFCHEAAHLLTYKLKSRNAARQLGGLSATKYSTVWRYASRSFCRFLMNASDWFPNTFFGGNRFLSSLRLVTSYGEKRNPKSHIKVLGLAWENSVNTYLTALDYDNYKSSLICINNLSQFFIYFFQCCEHLQWLPQCITAMILSFWTDRSGQTV